MSHADFLAEIQAEPAAAERRLVYADWLEERGDERGTYLRVEHTLGTTSPFVPRYWELKEQRRELRDGCEPDWLEAVGYPTYYTPMLAKLPRSRVARWRLVDRFVDSWYDEPLFSGSGNSDEAIAETESTLGYRLPAALREWYRLAGRRQDLWENGDLFTDLEELYLGETYDGGTLITFPTTWPRVGIDLVHVMRGDPPMSIFNQVSSGVFVERMTSFAVDTLVVGAIVEGRPMVSVELEGAKNAFAGERALARVRRRVNTNTVREAILYEGRDLLALVDDNRIHVAACSTAAYESLRPRTRRWLEHSA